MELKDISNLIEKTKAKVPLALRKRVLIKQFLTKISIEYPLTFLSIMHPNFSTQQVRVIVKSNPHALAELIQYQNQKVSGLK